MLKNCFIIGMLIALSASICTAEPVGRKASGPAGAPSTSGDEAGLEELMEGFEDDGTSEMDDLLEGFDDTPPETSAKDAAAEPRSKGGRFSVDGHLKLGASWNFDHGEPPEGQPDWRGISRLKPEIQIDANFKLSPRWQIQAGAGYFYDFAYTIKGRDTFSDDFLDLYEEEAEWREVYLQGSLGRRVDLKAGRQIVVWGKSDNIRITDVLNPLDMREPGLTDIEDLRLPVAMARLDGYWGPWSLTAIALPEIRFNKNPVHGSDFFPGAAPLPDEDIPSWGGDNTEWAVALDGIFSGKDISLYWADIFNDDAHAVLGPGFTITREHARVHMWGAAGDLASGNWLLKTEAAHFSGLKYFNSGNDTHERLDGLIGAEYSGWHETTLSLEFAVRHIIGFDQRLKAAPDYVQEDEYQWALRLTREFANDTIDLTLLASVYGPLGQDGAFERLSVSYHWTDAVSLTAGVVLYQSGDKYTLSNIEDNDRIFGEIKYSF